MTGTDSDMSKATDRPARAPTPTLNGGKAAQDARSQGGEGFTPYGAAIVQMEGEYPVAYRGMYRSAMSGRSHAAAIGAFCLSCMGYSLREVKACTCPACPLYPYRLGGRDAPRAPPGAAP